jgi:hypothetical protein
LTVSNAPKRCDGWNELVAVRILLGIFAEKSRSCGEEDRFPWFGKLRRLGFPLADFADLGSPDRFLDRE